MLPAMDPATPGQPRAAPQVQQIQTLEFASAPEPAAYYATLLGRLDRRWLGTPAGRAVLLLVLVASLLIPSIQAARTIRKTDESLFRAGGTRQRTALGRWLPTAALLRESPPKENPYKYGHWFPTPPLVLISLVPFTKLSYVAAGAAWAGLKVIGFVAVMYYLLRTLGLAGMHVPAGVLIAAGIFSIRPIISDLQHGNLNIFVLMWIGLAWCAYVRGRDGPAGLWLALAIVTKVTPGLLLVYFAYQRRWRLCATCLLGLIGFVILLPGIYLGFDRNLEYLRSWFNMLAAPYVFHGWATIEIANQSLYGVLMRILSNTGMLSLEHMPAQQAMAAGMEDMARPATTLGALLRPAISLTGLAALAWFCRDRTSSRQGLRAWLELSLVLLAMLLMGERTWKHHATTLPIVFLAMWMTLACVPWSPRFRAWFAASLAIQLFLLVLGGEGLMGDDLADRLMDGGIFCWGLLLAAVQIAILLVRLRRREQPELGESRSTPLKIAPGR